MTALSGLIIVVRSSLPRTAKPGKKVENLSVEVQVGRVASQASVWANGCIAGHGPRCRYHLTWPPSH